MIGRLASVIVLLIGTFGFPRSPPQGYRYPTEADRTGDWDTFKTEVPTPYRTEADFDGDGLLDEAWILLRETGKGWGLFVFFGTTDGSRRIITLEEDEGRRTAAQRMGVNVVEPGEYETACGKGYWDCVGFH